MRKLERNGLVNRRALATMPMTVEYILTDMGRTLLPIIQDLRDWSMAYIEAITAARSAFDQSAERTIGTCG